MELIDYVLWNPIVECWKQWATEGRNCASLKAIGSKSELYKRYHGFWNCPKCTTYMDSGDAYTDNWGLHYVMQYQYRNNNTFHVSW